MAMGDVQTAPAPIKDVSDRTASSQQGEQSWNGSAARDIWGKPPVPGQRTDSTPTQQNEAGKDTHSKTATPADATSSADDQAAKQTDTASDQSVKSTGPKEATTNANDQSRNNNANDQSQPTLQPQDQSTDKGQKDAPQLVAEVPQEATMAKAQATDSTANTQETKYSLPDGSTGVSEQTNEDTTKHYGLKLGVADNQFTITPQKEQSIINNAQTAFDTEIDRQIAALPGAALEGIGDGLNSLAQMGVFVGGTILNELQIVGDAGVLAVDTAVMPSFAAGDQNLLNNDSNALAAKGNAVMDGIGKTWAPVDQDCQKIGATGDYGRLLTDPVNAALQAYDKYSSQSAPEQVKQLADGTTQIVAPVAGEGLLGAASGLVRKEAVGAAATAADGTIGGAFQAKMSDLMQKMKETLGRYNGTAASEASDMRAVEPGIDGPDKPSNIERTRDHLEGADDLRPIADKIKLPVRSEETTEINEETGEIVKKQASPEFAQKVQDLVNQLDPQEKIFLANQKTEIVVVESIPSKFPGLSPNTAGIYRISDNKIYIPENVAGAENPATAFHIRHEIGHDFNINSPWGHQYPISERPAFQDAFDAACKSAPPGELKALGLTRNEAEYKVAMDEHKTEVEKYKSAVKAGDQGLKPPITPKTPAESRDEVFADLFAHATGEELKTGYSQRIEAAFSAQCEGFVKQKVQQYIKKLASEASK